MADFSDEINACKWLFMHEIAEPAGNELRLVIVEAKSSDRLEDLAAREEAGEALQTILQNASRIDHGPGCRIFELHWPSYIAYSVRNESFTTFDAYEEHSGRLFVQYSRSRYLDFVASATFADSTFPGPFQHYGLFCLDHIIDVVSMDPPSVTVSLRGGRSLRLIHSRSK